MKSRLAFLCVFALASLSGACTAAKSDSTTPSNGVVEKSAPNQNLNANNAPSNVGVVTNDNGNKNTAGVAPINANSNQNGNRNSNKH